MKKLLLITISVFCLSGSFAQDEIIKALTDDNYNFKVINGDVMWQYVYKKDMPADEIRKYFQQSRIFSIVSSDSTCLYGFVDKKPIEYAKYGFPTGSVPMYIIGSPCSYNVDVRIKDGRYQITIHDVVFNPAMAGVMFGSSSLQMTLNETSYNFNRNKFKSAFFSMNAAAILATAWYDLFSIKLEANSVTSDNW